MFYTAMTIMVDWAWNINNQFIQMSHILTTSGVLTVLFFFFLHSNAESLFNKSLIFLHPAVP